MFYCTRLDWDVRTILSHYAARWSVEVMHFNAKQMMGLEDPSNRTPARSSGRRLWGWRCTV